MPVADPRTLRQTAQGPVLGHDNGRGTHAWRGIPYAQPPVGELRWRAPRPPQPWDGRFEALRFGAPGVQFASAAIGSPQAKWGEIVGSEDCLSLNVFAPAYDPDAVPGPGARLPVMFWIHGGGNSAGATFTYGTLRNLAAVDRVVVVSVNYRLGVLGWFRLPEIAGDGASDEDRSGNYGTLDLIAALRWVRHNIAAFGGDPDRVTIFGESAGGQNVLSLLLAPSARGLFHRAIAQSPVADGYDPDEARNFVDDPKPGHPASALEIAARLRVADGLAADRRDAREQIVAMAAGDLAAYLRGKSPAELLAGFERNRYGIHASPRVLRDGVVLPARPMRDAFAESNGWNRVPVIIGANRDEMRLFMATDPGYVRMLGPVPLMRSRRRYLRDAGYLSRAWEMSGVHEIAAAMLASGHRDVWVYRFDWDEAPRIPLVRPDLLLGAAHAIEMAFVFRDVDGEADILRVNTRHNRPGREALSAAMAAYWSAFAHAGTPAAPGEGGRPAWPRRDEAAAGIEPGRACLVFDSPAGGACGSNRTGSIPAR